MSSFQTSQPAPPWIQEPDNNTTYAVAVKTSNVFNGGTDANVFVQLLGKYSNSECLELKSSINHRNKFERNRSDVFTFPNMQYLGDIQEVKIWHDNTGPSPSWCLDIVEVHDVLTNTIYSFPCGRWLAKNEDDGQLSRNLSCTKKRQHTPKHIREYEKNFSQGQQTNWSMEMPQTMNPYQWQTPSGQFLRFQPPVMFPMPQMSQIPLPYPNPNVATPPYLFPPIPSNVLNTPVDGQIDETPIPTSLQRHKSEPVQSVE